MSIKVDKITIKLKSFLALGDISRTVLILIIGMTMRKCLGSIQNGLYAEKDIEQKFMVRKVRIIVFKAR
jgi:hypothetical protein